MESSSWIFPLWPAIKNILFSFCQHVVFIFPFHIQRTSRGNLAPSIPFGLAVDKNIQSLDEGELAPAILVPTGFVPTQEPAEGWLCMGLALCFPYTCGKWPKALCARGWSQLSQHLAVAPALHLFVIRSLVSCGWNTLDSVCVASTGDSPRASKTAVPLHWKWDFSRI